MGRIYKIQNGCMMKSCDRGNPIQSGLDDEQNKVIYVAILSRAQSLPFQVWMWRVRYDYVNKAVAKQLMPWNL